MNIVLDTHSHTIVSGHAYNTMREMAQTAKVKGLEAISLMEHAPTMPGTTGIFYFQNLVMVPREMEGVRLFLGAELNILNETGEIDLPEWVCNTLDLCIASMHAPESCYGVSKGIVKNTEAYINAMKHPFVNIIGHPDDGRYEVDYETLVLAAKEHNVLLEINNTSLDPRGFRKNARGNQLKMLEYCKKYQVPISLGSDAHIDVELGNFCWVRTVLEEVEFPEELIINTSVDKLVKHSNLIHR